jgi:hypothetical protein
MTNPDNFVGHRNALLRLSIQVPALAAAYKITGDEKYATSAIRHLIAWFVADATKMNPHLKFAQAISGKVTGRGVGIIDTIHLIEVAKAISVLEHSRSLKPSQAKAIKKWFSEYLTWLTTHPYGIEERNAKNNHGTCWAFQVAAFAQLTGDSAKFDSCRQRFREVLLPGQMAADGSFPLELKRTKPYGYSLFNAEVMAGLCEILSTKDQNLWQFAMPDGRSMHKAMEFLYPFVKDKNSWPYGRDVMYWNNWPVRQSSLLFAGNAYGEDKYIALWKTLNADPTEQEVLRNFPIRQPVLWLAH